MKIELYRLRRAAGMVGTAEQRVTEARGRRDALVRVLIADGRYSRGDFTHHQIAEAAGISESRVRQLAEEAKRARRKRKRKPKPKAKRRNAASKAAVADGAN